MLSTASAGSAEGRVRRGQLYCVCKFSQHTTEALCTAAHMTNKTFIVSILETHNKKGVQFVSSLRAQSWDYAVTKLQPRGTLGIDSKMKSTWHLGKAATGDSCNRSDGQSPQMPYNVAVYSLGSFCTNTRCVQRETCKLFQVSSSGVQQPVHFQHKSSCIILTTAVLDGDIQDKEKGIFETCAVHLITRKANPNMTNYFARINK